MSEAVEKCKCWLCAKEKDVLARQIAWHVADKNKWQGTQAAHLAEITRLTAERDALASDRDGYVQLLTDENNKLRAEVDAAAEMLREAKARNTALTSRVEELEGALKWIDDQRYTDRDTISPDNAFEKVGNLNRKIIEIMDRARAAIGDTP